MGVENVETVHVVASAHTACGQVHKAKKDGNHQTCDGGVIATTIPAQIGAIEAHRWCFNNNTTNNKFA